MKHRRRRMLQAVIIYQNACVGQKNFSLAQATFLLNVERESIRSAFFVISRSYQERSDFVIGAP